MLEPNNKTTPFWIGIQGGSCAGKSTFAHALANRLGIESTLIISLDQFFLPFNRRAHSEDAEAHNFDHPASLDWALLREVSRSLNMGLPTQIPSVNYISGFRGDTRLTTPTKYIMLEGLWPFYDPFLSDLFHLRLYVDTPADLRLLRRLMRDVVRGERCWELCFALTYYQKFIRPMQSQYVDPGKEMAHIIINGEGSFEAGVERCIDMLVNLQKLS